MDARFLQNATAPPASAPQGRDVYEFIAFLAWYLFLVMCCVIPTACAYRRRRMLERRVARQSYLQRFNGMFIIASTENTIENEDTQKERARLIQERIKATTMTVAAKDLIRREDDDDDDGDKRNSGSGDITTAEEKMEQGDDGELEFSALRLPVDAPNGNRRVPPACAICLSSYAVGDAVTHSPSEHCQHAFHQECIVSWLAKKPQPLCPCCRQEFCQLPSYAGNNDSNDYEQQQQQQAHESNDGNNEDVRATDSDDEARMA